MVDSRLKIYKVQFEAPQIYVRFPTGGTREEAVTSITESLIAYVRDNIEEVMIVESPQFNAAVVEPYVETGPKSESTLPYSNR